MKFKKEVNELGKEFANGQHKNVFGCAAALALGMGAIIVILTRVPKFLCNLCSRAALSVIKLEKWFQNKKNNKKKGIIPKKVKLRLFLLSREKHTVLWEIPKNLYLKENFYEQL